MFVQQDPQTFIARDIKIGESNGELVQVADGLREGELVEVPVIAPREEPAPPPQVPEREPAPTRETVPTP